MERRKIIIALAAVATFALPFFANATTYWPQDDTILSAGNYDLSGSTFGHVATTTAIATTTLYFTFTFNPLSSSSGGQTSVHGQNCNNGIGFFSVWPQGVGAGNSNDAHTDLVWCVGGGGNTSEITFMQSSTVAGDLINEYYATATVGFANNDSLWLRGEGDSYQPHSLPGQFTGGAGETWDNGLLWGGICDASSFNPTTGCTGGGGGGASSTFGGSLAFPVNGSTIPDFTNWVANLTSNATGSVIYAQVLYTNQNATSATPYADTAAITLGPTQTSTTIVIPKLNTLFAYQNNNVATSSWTAQLFTSSDGYSWTLASTTTFTISPLLTAAPSGPNASSAGPYFFNPVQVFTGGTYYPTSLASSSAALEAQCTPPQNSLFGFFTGADEYYGLCATVNYLFVPNAGTQSILGDDVKTLQTVPPFSWFFTVNNDVMAGANGTSTVVNNGVAFTIDNGINGATSTMTLIPANLTTNTFLSDGRLVDDYYNFILTAAIIFSIIMMYKVIL